MGEKGRSGQKSENRKYSRKKDGDWKNRKNGKNGRAEGDLEEKLLEDHRKSAKAVGKKEKAFRNKHGIQKIDWKDDEKEDGKSEAIKKHKSGKPGKEGRKDPAKGRRNAEKDTGRKVKVRSTETAVVNAAAEEAETSLGENESRIEGRNAVLEAFRAGKTIDRLYVLDGCEDGPVLTIKRMAAKQGTQIRYLSRQRMDQISETGSHQGVIAVAAAYHYGTLDDLFRRAQERNEDPFFILLDNIEDPHNLGAIIRTANVVGAHGVIIPKDRAVGLTATVAKASAGALNFTPVVKVTNMAQTIEELKQKGLWFVCADMDGAPMTKLNLTGPIGMVVGAEGEGVSRLVKEKCDIVAAIPQRGEINSLNASVAAGVLAYEILRQRG